MTAIPGPTAVLLAVSLWGALLLARRLTGRHVRPSWGWCHGVLAIAALAWALASIWGVGAVLTANAGVFCLVLAAIGGAFVALFRLQGERPPLFMVWLHAVAAVLGVGLLLTA